MFLLKASLESNFDFSLVPNAVDFHYDFQSEKKIMSCPFYVNFAGEVDI